MGRGIWWATVHRVRKSQTRLKRLHTCTPFSCSKTEALNIGQSKLREEVERSRVSLCRESLVDRVWDGL